MGTENWVLRQPRGATPRLRSGAAGRRHPTSEVRGGDPESHPEPEAKGGSGEETPMPEARANGIPRSGGCSAQEGLEELSHIEGHKQCG